MHINYVLYLVGTGVAAFVAAYAFMELTHVMQQGTLGRMGKAFYTLLSLSFVAAFVVTAIPPLRALLTPVWTALGYYPAEHIAQMVVAVVSGGLGVLASVRSEPAS